MWILHFAAHAMLGGFTFISGYLLVHQRDKMLQQSYKTFMFRKSRRLLLPGILFSLLYIWMFEEHAFSALLRFCYTLSDGHMWYLPMLMWCLFYGYYLLKHDISLKKAAIVSLFLLSLYFLPLPFNLRRFFLYVPYFTFGMMAYAYRDWIIKKSELLLKWGGYLCVFVICTMLILYLNGIPQENLWSEFVIKETRTYIRVLSGIVGVWVYWCTSLYVTRQRALPFWIRSISRYSFGIYLYQQFILQILLYHTSIPQQVGTVALPWLYFVITLLLSWGMAYLTSKTRIGKFLLG